MSNPEAQMLDSMTRSLNAENYNAIIADDQPWITLVIAGIVFRPDWTHPTNNRRWIGANGVTLKENRLSDLVEFGTVPVVYIPPMWM